MVLYDEANNVIYETDELDDPQNAGIRFFTQYILHHGTNRWPAVGLSGVLRYALETPGDQDDNEPIDIGVSLGLSKRWSDSWYTYFSCGLTYYGQNEFLMLELDETIFSAMLGLEWRWRPNFSILAQYQAVEGAVEDFGKLSDSSHEVTFGFKWQPSSSLGVVEFGLIENIVTYDNSPDFGLHLAYTHQF